MSCLVCFEKCCRQAYNITFGIFDFTSGFNWIDVDSANNSSELAVIQRSVRRNCCFIKFWRFVENDVVASKSRC
jgi:hypothetical protein